MKMLSEMLELAVEAHDGQVDLAGVPYIFHIMAVTEFTRQRWGHEDEELLCIAAGHDLLEDTEVTWQFLFDNFNARVANGILKLSRFEGQTEEEYRNNILDSIDAMKIKLCDLRHNLDSSRLPSVDKNAMDRMKKYKVFQRLLEEKLNEMEFG